MWRLCSVGEDRKDPSFSFLSRIKFVGSCSRDKELLHEGYRTWEEVPGWRSCGPGDRVTAGGVYP